MTRIKIDHKTTILVTKKQIKSAGSVAKFIELWKQGVERNKRKWN